MLPNPSFRGSSRHLHVPPAYLAHYHTSHYNPVAAYDCVRRTHCVLLDSMLYIDWMVGPNRPNAVVLCHKNHGN